MTDYDSTFFSDEEIHKELENLGITVSQEIFEKMRQDLVNMVSSDISDLSLVDVKNCTISETDDLSLNSVKRSLFQEQTSNASPYLKSYETSLQNQAFPARNYRLKSKSFQLSCSSTDVSISTSDLLSTTPNLPNIYENNEIHQTNPKNEFSKQYYSEEERCRTSYKSLPNHHEERVNYKTLPELSSYSETNEISYLKPGNSEHIKKFPGVQQINDISTELDSFQIDDSPKIESILGDYRKRLINYKVGNRLRRKIVKAAATASDSEQEALSKNETSLNSTVTDGKMKRKTLRYKDGKPFITEQLVDIPSVFSSCYPSSLSTTNSFSSDLSFKSNSSTGSLVALSPESTPRSTLSNTSNILTKPPRKKKSDPVAMYNYYKKFWDNFKPPGEKSHQKLRWAVRDKMLDYSL